jgi:hypothetical protein
LFFAALGLADRPCPRERRVSGFEVLATDENQQQKNEQGIDSHCSPRSIVINLVAMTRGRLQGFFASSRGNDYSESKNVSDEPLSKAQPSEYSYEVQRFRLPCGLNHQVDVDLRAGLPMLITDSFD